MIGFNGRLHFKQYVKNKPTKYGIKVWCVAEPKTGYMLNFRFYTGKNNDPMPDGVGHHVVMNTAHNYLDKGYCIFFDNYFASIKLAEDLLKRITYSCATVRPSRKGWPFPAKRKMNKGTVQMKQKGNVVALQWMDKRLVNVVSTCSQPTMGQALRRTKNGQESHAIPTPVLDYNSNMGGVDLADQYRSYYEVGRSGKKWWRYAFWFLVQTSIVNAFLLMKAANPAARRRTPANSHIHFRLSLLDSLISGVPARTTSLGENPSISGRATPAAEAHKLVQIPGRKKRCFQCSKNKNVTASGRSVETVFGCLLCGIHLCKGHCHTDYHSSLL